MYMYVQQDDEHVSDASTINTYMYVYMYMYMYMYNHVNYRVDGVRTHLSSCRNLSLREVNISLILSM